MSKILDQKLRAMAIGKQAEYFDAVAEHGGIRQAARALGVPRDTVRDAIRRLEARAAKSDPGLHSNGAPAGYHLSGVSTLRRDEYGNPQWVKTKADEANRIAVLKEAMEEIADIGRGKLALIRAPSISDSDTLSVYPFADPHIGMLSWAAETGADYDLKIAEEAITATAEALIACSPPSEEALYIDLGDFLHVDNQTNRTPASGNQLDTDTRFAKIAIAGIRIKRRIIDRLLYKHKRVVVWSIAGNHDENTSMCLSIALAAAYEREPRVEIVVNPERHQSRRFGRDLIGAAHGHTSDLKGLPNLMAAKWPEDWGCTKHRIWYTGHVHHDSSFEAPGCLVETLRTVAAPDAWTAGKGYMSGRDLKCDVWHKEHGRIERHIKGVVG